MKALNSDGEFSRAANRDLAALSARVKNYIMDCSEIGGKSKIKKLYSSNDETILVSSAATAIAALKKNESEGRTLGQPTLLGCYCERPVFWGFGGKDELARSFGRTCNGELTARGIEFDKHV